VWYRLLVALEKEIGGLVWWHGGGVVWSYGARLGGVMQVHRRIGEAPYRRLRQAKKDGRLMSTRQQVQQKDERVGVL
jgi:hypothetical protein